MDYLIGQAAAGLALVTAGVASFVVRDVILERIKRKARQYENYLSITGDPNVRAGARFRAIRTIEGEEFCGPGMGARHRTGQDDPQAQRSHRPGQGRPQVHGDR